MAGESDKALDGRSVDYLVISHLEPDHASNIQRLAEKYPEMKLVGNAKIFSMLPQFFDFDFSEKKSHGKRRRYVKVWENHTLQSLWRLWHTGGSYGGIWQSKDSFLCRRLWKVWRIGRRRGLDRRSQKIFYQYCRKIRCAGTRTY